MEPGVGYEPTFTVASSFAIKLSRYKLEPCAVFGNSHLN